MVETVDSSEFERSDFTDYYNGVSEPLLIKGEASDWDATRKWDPEYLDCSLGFTEITLSFHEEGAFNPNNDEGQSETLPFTEARNRIDEDGRYYLAQEAIDIPWFVRVTTESKPSLPELAEDVPQPRFLEGPSRFARYTNVWFGGDRCKTALHHDSMPNLFVQIYGKKRFYFFAPSQTEYLYPARGAAYPNHSRVNVFDPDESKFPRYTKAESEELVVEPGDMLYIPQLWWHAVDTLTNSISVNFWWEETDTLLRSLGKQVFRERFKRRLDSVVANALHSED